MLAPPRRRDRCDDALLLPERLRILAQQRIVGGGEGEAELGLQLLAPLPDQRGGDENQHALGHAAQRVFLQHHAGLDRLAQADLVGEQHAAAELLQDFAHGLDLMPQRLDADDLRQAQELVESLREMQMGEALAQLPPAAVRLGPMRDRAQHGREVGLDRKVDVDVDPGQVLQLDGGGLGCGRWRGLAGRRGCATARRGLAGAGLGRSGARRWRALVALHDRVDLLHQPVSVAPPAGESMDRGRPFGQPVLFQQSPRGHPFVELKQRQCVQQAIGLRRVVTLGYPLEKHQCPLGTVLQKSCRGGKHENDRVVRMGADCRFGKREETGVPSRLVEGLGEPHRARISVLRRVEGQDGLARQGGRHGRRRVSGPAESA
jgi:hypothetical protein